MQQVEQQRQRMMWMDILRGLLIITVVVGHTTALFSTYVYQFHMGAFFLVSGYMTQQERRSVLHTAYHRTLTLYVPVLTAIIMVQSLVQVIRWVGLYDFLFPESHNFLPVIDSVKNFFRYGSSYVWWLSATWFVAVLYGITLLHRIIFQVCRQKYGVLYALITLGFLALGYWAVANEYGRRWNVDLILMGQFYYALGIFIRQLPAIRKKIQPYIYAIGVVVTVCLMVGVFDRLSWSMEFVGRRFNAVPIDVLLVLNGCLCGYCLSRLLEHTCVAKPLAYIGKNTLAVVMFHFLCFKIWTAVLCLFGQLPISDIASYLPPKGPDDRYWVCYVACSIAGSLLIWNGLMKFRVMRVLLGQDKKAYDHFYQKLMKHPAFAKVDAGIDWILSFGKPQTEISAVK